MLDRARKTGKDEVLEMKTYWEVDTTSAETWEMNMQTTDREVAIADALANYKHLSNYDKKRRLSYEACLAEADEDGCLDMDTATDWVDIVEMYKTQKEKEEEER